MQTPILFVTAIYTSILALMLIPLAIQVIKMRRKHRVSLMDGDIDDLKRAIRAHGNFTEYVPLCLLLIAFCEINGAHPLALHSLGSILVAGRLFHINAIMTSSLKKRVIGMTATFTTLVAGAILLISTLFAA